MLAGKDGVMDASDTGYLNRLNGILSYVIEDINLIHNVHRM